MCGLVQETVEFLKKLCCIGPLAREVAHVLLLEHDKVIMNRISAEKGCLVWDGQLKQP